MKTPDIQQLNDVCVIPYVFNRREIFVGGIESDQTCRSGRLIHGYTARDVPVKRPENFDYLRGRYLYGGPLWNHFGHIFVDCLHRLWAYTEKYDAIVFNGVIGLRDIRSPEKLLTWKYPAYVDDILSLMGIKAKIHITRRPTVYENLAVPEPGSVLECGVRPFYWKFLKNYQKNIQAAVQDLPAPERVYYPRTHLIPTFGGIIGSSYFESVLQRSGFTVCHPERSDIYHQFANILNSQILVFDEGSSIHLTSILHTIPTKMYMFPRRKGLLAYTSALEPKGSLTVLSHEENLIMFKDRRGGYQPACSSTYNDVEKVMDAMRDHGLTTEKFNKNEYMRFKMNDFKLADEGRHGVS